MSAFSHHHPSGSHFNAGRAYPRSRTLSMSSTASSSASSAYGWGGAAPTILTPSPQPLPGQAHHSDPAWGAFVPPSMHNSGLGATHALLRFVKTFPHTTQNSSSKSGTRPGSQSSAPDSKRRQDRRRSANPKTVTFDLQPHFFVTTDAEKYRSPLSNPSLRHPLPPSTSSSATSSASSSRSPSPGRDSRDQSDSDSDLSPYPGAPGSGLHPVLARVERSSKFCAGMMVCATCSKQGRDYPACGKCNKMWCSRECRLQGGKRHVC